MVVSLLYNQFVVSHNQIKKKEGTNQNIEAKTYAKMAIIFLWKT